MSSYGQRSYATHEPVTPASKPPTHAEMWASQEAYTEGKLTEKVGAQHAGWITLEWLVPADEPELQDELQEIIDAAIGRAGAFDPTHQAIVGAKTATEWLTHMGSQFNTLANREGPWKIHWFMARVEEKHGDTHFWFLVTPASGMDGKGDW
jgi:hypothetical protein